MANSWISFFVPGRLCLVGEHSDWCGGLRSTDAALGRGQALVAGTSEGLRARARARLDGLLVLSSALGGDARVSPDALLAAARDPADVWRFAAGVAYVVRERLGHTGLQLALVSDLPAAKGLSSSASVCVAAARAFNRVYRLHLTPAGEMDLAYAGERLTGSLCGRMDQCVAFGPRVVARMQFDGELTTHTLLPEPAAPVYIVFADLAAEKVTSVILRAMQTAVVRGESDQDRALARFLGETSSRLVDDVADALRDGDAKRVGALYTAAQAAFDAAAIPVCPEQLTAPRLHEVMSHPRVLPLVHGAKGVGSQGDGSVQFVARGKAEADELVTVLESLGMPDAYILPLGAQGCENDAPDTDLLDVPAANPNGELPVLRTVKTAVITAAGYGTRLFPASRSIRPKPLMPIIDKDGYVKPLLLSIAELCIAEGMEKVIVVSGPGEQAVRVREVFSPLDPSSGLGKALKPWMRDYAASIGCLSEKVEIVIQDIPEGFGHAVTMAAGLVGTKPFVLLLGDVIFKSASGFPSCLRQCLDVFERDPSGRSVIGVSEVPASEAGAYGVIQVDDDVEVQALKVLDFVEKPNKLKATELATDGMCKIVLGPYVFTNEVMDTLCEDVTNDSRLSGEIQLTPAVARVRKRSGLLAVGLCGDALDTGNPKEYASTMIELAEHVLPK